MPAVVKCRRIPIPIRSGARDILASLPSCWCWSCWWCLLVLVLADGGAAGRRRRRSPGPSPGPLCRRSVVGPLPHACWEQAPRRLFGTRCGASGALKAYPATSARALHHCSYTGVNASGKVLVPGLTARPAAAREGRFGARSSLPTAPTGAASWVASSSASLPRRSPVTKEHPRDDALWEGRGKACELPCGRR